MLNYGTLSRRTLQLEVVLPVQRASESPHLVIENAGLKTFGAGERKVRKRGYSKRRPWRAEHLAMDAKSLQIWAAPMRRQTVGDADVFPELLDQILVDRPLDTVGGDGAYEAKEYHAAWSNEANEVTAQSCRHEWKKSSDYRFGPRSSRS